MNGVDQIDMYTSQIKRKKDVNLLRQIMTDKGLTELGHYFAFYDIVKAKDFDAIADTLEGLTPDEIARFIVHMFDGLAYWWEVDTESGIDMP